MFDRYYGLTANPFQLTPDARFYFESATHRKALSYLGYGLAQGEGFIVITGEIGSGKTTLVHHLMATIDRSRLTASTIVTSALDARDCVQMAAESFEIEARGLDKAATLKAIEHYLHDEARAGRRCLLIVDEAQNLSIEALEELRMLSNFQLGGQALLQTFLLGQPEFRDRIEGESRLEQLRQRVIATHHLGAMERGEVEPYIIHRLSKVGWDGRPDITPEAIGLLYDETGGMPRKVNALLTRLLLLGAVEECDMLDASMMHKVIADQRNSGDVRQAEVQAAELAPAPAETVTAETNAHEQEVAEKGSAFAITTGESGQGHVPAFEQVSAPQSQPEDEDDAVSEPASATDNRQEPETMNEPELPTSFYGDWDETSNSKDAPMAQQSDDVAERNEKLEAELAEMREHVAGLEKRIDAQDNAVKQVLSILIDWAEHGAPFTKPDSQDNSRAA